jgi:hypothetical protein
MCIVIDTNVLANVFNKNAENHNEFKPVLEWILFGKGKIVYGGSKYKRELLMARKYFRLFVELKRKSKIIELDCQSVDNKQNEVSNMLVHRDFDDPHLVAILIISRCRLICSEDSRAFPFLKDGAYYPKHMVRPKIYCRESNKDLLCDNNIAEICKPCQRLSNEVAQQFID